MTISWVGLDADDTLWHNESYFIASYELFAELVAPYLQHEPDPVVAAHDHLIATEIRNIPWFGYGIKGATLSMIECALELSNQQIPSSEVYRLVERAKEMMAHPVELIDGVVEALDALAHHRLILITKGDVMDQRRKIEQSTIAERFDAIEIIHEKDPATYAAALARHGIDPTEFVMIGNSLKSDVAPVLALGGWGIHVPYVTTWALESAEEPTDHPRFRSAVELGQVASLIERLEANEA
jgi:putative hydrolase of the HAD superfamily